MNRTIKSLISRGIDSKLAKKIVDEGYTITSLSTCSIEKRKRLGIDENLYQQIFDSSRPPISEEIVDNLFNKSRRTCCICRDSTRSIIIHHIEEWSVCMSNKESNLVVLCLQHHDEAHTKRELSQNLTPKQIKSAKQKWEKKVRELDKQILNTDFKELNVTTEKLSNLKKQWYKFLQNLGMKVEIISDPFEKLKFDFRIFGKTNLLVKVFEIEKIDDLINVDDLKQDLYGDHFLDSLIVLGVKPFLSNDGYYSGEQNIQIGWIYSYGEGSWDNVMLKEKNDISNSKFYVENLLYENTNYKNFLTKSDYSEIMRIWND
ncbi:MAG: hypothetical protein ABFC90_09775 [Bacteroidales bacterium]|nr:HNH endonuclease [Bacteroidales bacterium]